MAMFPPAPVKIVVPNFGWLRFPTWNIVFGENLFFLMVVGLAGFVFQPWFFRGEL